MKPASRQHEVMLEVDLEDEKTRAIFEDLSSISDKRKASLATSESSSGGASEVWSMKTHVIAKVRNGI